MAGHSKWNNIKNRKGAVDARRAKTFSAIGKLIKAAVKEGGSGDPQFNPNLRTILDKARSANMPKDNIQRAIERGLGKSASGKQLQETVYEGFGPGGVAVLAVAISDNPNRTGADIRFMFSKAGGSLAGPGSASYMFARDDHGGYVCNMPLEGVSEADTAKVLELVDSLLGYEDVEDVFTALPVQEEDGSNQEEGSSN